MISFNKNPIMVNTHKYIDEALSSRTSGDGVFTKRCSDWIEKRCGSPHALLTTSGSHALDMSARLCNIQSGDEVIMSSYTFSSTANSFVACGAKIVFVDIRPDTMNIDETKVEAAITDRTRVIVPMHYAGVSCEMNFINHVAKKHGLHVVEDAAQGVMALYMDKALGTFGDFGCFSFHETKNYSMGEGGALLINNKADIERAEIIREKGTNRSRFFRGEIDKYSWVDWGSSYLPSEINAAYLWSQLEIAEDINNARMIIWNQYYQALSHLVTNDFIELPYIPIHCQHNAHLFYLKVKDNAVQIDLIAFLKTNGINALFHYIPLHSSEAGRKFGMFHGEDKFTTKESQRLIRLPIWYGLSSKNVNYICEMVSKFFIKTY